MEQGKITFENDIGEGAYGKIFKGTYYKTSVAIKQFNVDASNEEKDAIKKECTILSKLKHPNIIAVYGYHFCPFYIVMELMPNGDLYKYLSQNPNLNQKLKHELMYDIGCGLYYLHLRNCVHGDLKSMNVLLTRDLRAKISDFGTTRLRTRSIGVRTIN